MYGSDECIINTNTNTALKVQVGKGGRSIVLHAPLPPTYLIFRLRAWSRCRNFCRSFSPYPPSHLPIPSSATAATYMRVGFHAFTASHGCVLTVVVAFHRCAKGYQRIKHIKLNKKLKIFS